MSADTPKPRSLKVLGTVFGIVGLIFMLYSGSVELHYAHTRPRVASVQDGRIYLQDTHGTIVYLTREEHSHLNLLYGLALLFLVCFGITVYLEMKRKKLR